MCSTKIKDKSISDSQSSARVPERTIIPIIKTGWRARGMVRIWDWYL